MRRINFFTTESGNKPVQKFLDNLSDKQAEKILWVLRLVREYEKVPRQYLKKLINTDGLWEVRTVQSGNTLRLLGFFDGNELIILTNGFQKKTQKTPKKEIVLAQKRKKIYLARKKMDDLDKYIAKRKKKSPAFAAGFEKGYKDFKIGVLLKMARENAGLTQEQVAQKLSTKKSAISRIENHAEDIRLSTIKRFAEAVGKQIELNIV